MPSLQTVADSSMERRKVNRLVTPPLTSRADAPNMRAMNVNMWDTLFNLVLLLFWSAMFTRDEREWAANPFLVNVARLQRGTVGFIQPVLPFLGRRMVALGCLLFLLLFRGFVLPANAEWGLQLGFTGARFQPGTVLTRLMFSVVSFALFLFKLWGVSLIYVHRTREAGFRPSSDALSKLARPFTDLAVRFRPAALLALGMLLAYALSAIGRPLNPGAGLPLVVLGARSFILALSGWVAVLQIVQSCLLLMIIGSWVSMFTGAHGLAHFCREWIDLLVGPIRRYPLRIGMLDLTPLVFLIGIGFLHDLLQGILFNSFRAVA